MKFEEGIQELDLKKMVQVSMDGPSVNWKLYDNIIKERNQNYDYPALIDTGSCSLHVVHGDSEVVCRRQNGNLLYTHTDAQLV